MIIKKNIFAFLMVIFSAVVFSQQKFDCDNITTRKLLGKYQELKHLGLDYKFPTGQEVIPVMLKDIFDDRDVKQICIDQAYHTYLQGVENMYIYYIRSIKNISRESFNRNYDYLLIFDKIVFHLEYDTNYQRKR